MRTILLALILIPAALLLSCSGDRAVSPTGPSALEMEIQDEPVAMDATGKAHPGIPPWAQPHGQSYGKWSELWWQWMASAPATPEENPVLDETGALIDYAQSGSVWFLAGSMAPGVVRTGTIPAGKALFVSIIAAEASSYEGLGETEAELRAAAASVAALIQVMSFELDGRAYEIGPAYRIQSEGMFALTVPDYNVFDWWGYPAEAGVYYPSVADGYYVMLPPLSVGAHTLAFSWGIPEFDLFADVTYHLEVTAN